MRARTASNVAKSKAKEEDDSKRAVVSRCLMSGVGDCEN